MRVSSAVVAAFALLCSAVVAAPAAARSGDELRTYVVDGVRTSLDRAAVAATGAAIVEADHGFVVVSASPGDARRLRRLRYGVRRRPVHNGANARPARLRGGAAA